MKTKQTLKVEDEGWIPQRIGGLYCSPRCGAGCLWGDYQVRAWMGEKVLAKLGPGWKVRVWENFGWHVGWEFGEERQDASRRVEIYWDPPCTGQKLGRFSALLHRTVVVDGTSSFNVMLRRVRRAAGVIAMQAETEAKAWREIVMEMRRGK